MRPNNLAGVEIENVHPGRRLVITARGTRIRDGDNDAVFRDRDAPMDPSQRGTLPDFGSPNERSGFRVQAVDVAGLLTGHDDVAAITQRGDGGRRTEIEIRAIFFWTTWSASPPTCHIECVTAGALIAPDDFTGIHVDCNDCVGKFRRGCRCVFSRTYIDAPAFRVDCRRCPNRRPGRAPHLCPGTTLVRLLCVSGHVGRP